ncbi:LysR substrate-binding domain-containing protein [Tabrizicola sp.]|uniref:LysR substrate-binding domain-containing protein n=1 Tax=Tabrizicola sp. TaxID=2005166 RepID=UPI00260EA21E|nr:LysR substrate-binding domain-containing protein [Tabrizicola sp.]MDM7931506.1 LysR substrate-binding domain-containing protein [Tabrizicola sp.]
MKSDLPPLTWLRAFEAAARTLSFTNAGAELNLTQAAVSKHVKALELYLHQPLFIRRPRSLELTKLGEAYLPKVQDALERLATGTREVFGRRRSQVLTLRCAVSFAVYWLSSRLPAFLDAYPDVQVRVISSVWNDPFDKDAFDLDIQYGTGDWPGFSHTRLTRDTITPLCAPGLAGRNALQSPADLRHHRLLHVMGYQEGWGVWLNAAGARGVDPGQGLHLDTSLTAFRIAADGGGIALGRSSLAAEDLVAGRLIAPFALKVPIDEAFYLLEPQIRPAHPFRDVFASWIKGQASAQLPGVS